MSLDGCSDVSKNPTPPQPVVWYDNLSEDKQFIFANKKEREDRAQCIGDYISYKHQKENNKSNPFDRFLR